MEHPYLFSAGGRWVENPSTNEGNLDAQAMTRYSGVGALPRLPSASVLRSVPTLATRVPLALTTQGRDLLSKMSPTARQQISSLASSGVRSRVSVMASARATGQQGTLAETDAMLNSIIPQWVTDMIDVLPLDTQMKTMLRDGPVTFMMTLAEMVFDFVEELLSRIQRKANAGAEAFEIGGVRVSLIPTRGENPLVTFGRILTALFLFPLKAAVALGEMIIEFVGPAIEELGEAIADVAGEVGSFFAEMFGVNKDKSRKKGPRVGEPGVQSIGGHVVVTDPEAYAAHKARQQAARPKCGEPGVQNIAGHCVVVDPEAFTAHRKAQSEARIRAAFSKSRFAGFAGVMGAFGVVDPVSVTGEVTFSTVTSFLTAVSPMVVPLIDTWSGGALAEQDVARSQAQAEVEREVTAQRNIELQIAQSAAAVAPGGSVDQLQSGTPPQATAIEERFIDLSRPTILGLPRNVALAGGAAGALGLLYLALGRK